MRSIIEARNSEIPFFPQTHFMLYGTGFQTWEYSPEFALRSYAYVALHAFPAFLYGWLLQSNKMLVFYFLRWILAFVCALCEVHFYRQGNVRKL